jgi:EAL domain-containing protein (putative c-di-GMP-specific phosphodiesterase class I)
MLFKLGILNIENFAIIEQNFGSSMSEYLDEVVYKIFKKKCKNKFFLQKIDYNSYLFLTMDYNNKSILIFVEDVLSDINCKQTKHRSASFKNNPNMFFIAKIGFTDYINNEDIQKAFNQAQVALFECSHEKAYNYSFYRTSLTQIQRHVNYTDLLAGFIDAMENDRLILEYQPIVNSHSRKSIFYECLLRIVDENGNRLSAFSHIKSAEEYGFIRNIDKFVLTKATSTLHKYPDLNLHINISGSTITDPDWIELAQKLFYKKDFDNRLTIEITELAIIKDFRCANFFINMLKELGCRISVDDFGSGYSSYARLKNIDVDSVKIGGDYIIEMIDNKNSMLFVKALVNLAKNLELEIIAEHVGNEKIARLLAEMGVNYLQGYLFPNQEFI